MGDWIVARNRFRRETGDGGGRKADACLRELSLGLGFRMATGLSDRAIFQQLFPFGLTAIDAEAETAGIAFGRLDLLAARHEIRTLLAELQLPTATTGARQISERRHLSAQQAQAVDLPDLTAP